MKNKHKKKKAILICKDCRLPMYPEYINFFNQRIKNGLNYKDYPYNTEKSIHKHLTCSGETEIIDYEKYLDE